MKFKNGSILLFPVCPVASFLIACAHLRYYLNGITFMLFYAFFGFCHQFTDVRLDSYRKMVSFLYDFPTLTLGKIWQEYQNGELMDIFESILFMYFRYFTSDIRIVYAFVGLLGGFFIYLLLRKVLEYTTETVNLYVYILVVLFLLVYNPVHMGGIRHFVAMSIFSYFSFLFLIEKRNWAAIPLALTFLIHFGYFVNFVVVVAARLLYREKFISLLWWAAIVSMIISVLIPPDFWMNMLGQIDTTGMNESISSRANSYGSDETAAEFSKSLTYRLGIIAGYIQKVFFFCFLYIMKHNQIAESMEEDDKAVYGYFLIFLCFGQILSSYSAVGSRYMLLGDLFFLFLLFRLYSFYGEVYDFSRFVKVIPLAYFYTLSWVIYNCMYLLDVNFFLSPTSVLFTIDTATPYTILKKYIS